MFRSGISCLQLLVLIKQNFSLAAFYIIVWNTKQYLIQVVTVEHRQALFG